MAEEAMAVALPAAEIEVVVAVEGLGELEGKVHPAEAGYDRMVMVAVM